MGCPEAIVSSLEGREGIERIEYMQETDVFELEFDPERVSKERIFVMIEELGARRGLGYSCSEVTGDMAANSRASNQR